MIVLAALLLAEPAVPDSGPPAPLATAMAAFAGVCLAHPDSGAQARAEAERAGFVRGETLPLAGGLPPLVTFDKPPLALLFRERPNGEFGCVLLFRHEEGISNAAVADAVTALPGIAPRSSSGNPKRWRAAS